jgi:hypothetical protein
MSMDAIVRGNINFKIQDSTADEVNGRLGSYQTRLIVSSGDGKEAKIACRDYTKATLWDKVKFLFGYYQKVDINLTDSTGTDNNRSISVLVNVNSLKNRLGKPESKITESIISDLFIKKFSNVQNTDGNGGPSTGGSINYTMTSNDFDILDQMIANTLNPDKRSGEASKPINFVYMKKENIEKQGGICLTGKEKFYCDRGEPNKDPAYVGIVFFKGTLHLCPGGGNRYFTGIDYDRLMPKVFQKLKELNLKPLYVSVSGRHPHGTFPDFCTWIKDKRPKD